MKEKKEKNYFNVNSFRCIQSGGCDLERELRKYLRRQTQHTHLIHNFSFHDGPNECHDKMKRFPSVEDVNLCDFNWDRFLRIADEFPH